MSQIRRALSPHGVLMLALPVALLLPAVSHAQSAPIKPYVMLMFDSSGSMRYPVCRDGYSYINGDNSNECQGNLLACSTCSCGSCGNPNPLGCSNTLHDDARLFKLKAGASAVINAYGEVVFGMARFHQVPNTELGPSYPLNSFCHHEWDDIRYSGGWIGAPDYCNNAAMGNGFNRADVIVPFADSSQTELLSWLDNCDDYPTKGQCPVGVMPGTGSEPLTPATCAAGSLCADCGTACDKELRGAGWTAIAGSLYDLRTRYYNGATGVIANDPKAACRPYKVILLTDGDDQCRGVQEVQAGLLYNNPTKSIPVHVIGFASTALQANLDQVAQAGGTGQAVMVDNEVTLALAIAKIVSESILHEKCNGIDDDCNGACDEAWPEVGAGAGCLNASAPLSCTVGIGICQRTGHYVCKADGTGSQCSVTAGAPNPGGEICNNGLDDNCDGRIDEGCTGCIPQAENCNGKDDNCNGQIDEGYVSVPCGSDIGECKRGTTACVNGQVVCQGATGPATELCDNKDNNCDTVVDGFTSTCYASATGTAYTSGCNLGSGACVGSCQLGLSLCTNGLQGACVGAIGPVPEICNGKDDNCDGQVDEGVQNSCTNFTVGPQHCQSYQTCAACPQTPLEVCNLVDDDCNGTVDDVAPTPCGSNVGECKKGTTACNAAGQQICSGEVLPTAEICDGKDNDCNGKIDDNVPGTGVACGNNTGECKAGTMQCVAGKLTCVGGVGPQPEVCDGKDNDCNGTADDGIAATPCGSDVGECKLGSATCQNGVLSCQGGVGPQPELCDGKDNDCNGVADDNPTDAGLSCGSAVGACIPGKQQCVLGKLVCVGEVGPKVEVCDGIDNDCNGTVDDNVAGAGAVCGNSVGECKEGVMGCQQLPTGWALVCTGGVGPKPEICDGKDNDCNGTIDDTYPEQGQTCGTNTGECQSGNWKCDAGQLICEGGVGPTVEVCDGKDNDCNGSIDDNVQGEGQPCGNNVGECTPGTTKCFAGKIICNGGTLPGEEICDGKDNNCDGKTDEGAQCPGGSACVEGQCLLPCTSGEFNCPGGSSCINGYCIPEACASAQCTATQRCTDGKCVEKCANVTCKTHARCEPTTGQCVDDSCHSKGCPGTQVCVAYVCKDNPCGAVSCGVDQMCVAGKCLETCSGKTCPQGERCVQGQCKDDPCLSEVCLENQVCSIVDGKAKCVPDPCRIIACAPGEVCKEGLCIDDPCLTTRCPIYLRCELNYLQQPDCVPIPGSQGPATKKMLATGAGGFGCAVVASDAAGALPLWPAFLLGLIALLLRSRRR